MSLWYAWVHLFPHFVYIYEYLLCTMQYSECKDAKIINWTSSPSRSLHSKVGKQPQNDTSSVDQGCNMEFRKIFLEKITPELGLKNKYKLDSYQETYSLQGQNLKQWFPNIACLRITLRAEFVFQSPLQRFSHLMWGGAQEYTFC